jgi:TatD DNase family protein
MFIDTHCHLDDPSLADRLPEVLAAAARVGVDRFIVPGVEPTGWSRIATLSREVRGIHAAYGLHPMHANLYTSELRAELERRLPIAVAVGEIGLDYTYADMPREVQLSAFRDQVRIAVDLGLPLLIHCRRAFRDMLDILHEEGAKSVGGVLHAFSGSPETASECIGMGFFVSVSGTVTYDNAVRPLEVVRQIPLSHLVLETDAPDMTPEPYRGKPNEPAFLLETARKVAELKGVSLAEVESITTDNAKKVFRELDRMN